MNEHPILKEYQPRILDSLVTMDYVKTHEALEEAKVKISEHLLVPIIISGLEQAKSTALASEMRSKYNKLYPASAVQMPAGAVAHVARVAVSEQESEAAPNSERKTPVSRFEQDFDRIEEIGNGGYGVVYSARHKLDRGVYAIKKIEFNGNGPRAMHRCQDEVLALKHLQHPHIVAYSTAWLQNDNTTDRKLLGGNLQFMFIQMELCQSSLADWLKDNDNASLVCRVQNKTLIMQWFGQAISALKYIHNESENSVANIIHRDLKPGNIFLSSNKGQQIVKVGDFGLVAVDEQKSHTQVGTTLYMAPEQHTGDYDSKVDVYAMGLVLFQLLYPCGEPQNDYAHRSKLFRAVKQRKFPNDFLKQHLQEADLIKTMVKYEAESRPTSLQLAQHESLLKYL